MFDRPPGRLREVAVEVQGPLRNSGVRIERESEAQTFVDIAHADDFVHPGVRKGTILLIMSTRPSAKVSNAAGSAYGSRGPRFAGNGATGSISRLSRNLANRAGRSEEHTSELQSRSDLVCRLLLEKKKKNE